MPESQFDWDPANYERARPTYPAALFDDLWGYLDPAARSHPATIEVGPGTGQATQALLARGAQVTAIELGPQLAAFLAAKFTDQPSLRVINAAFEEVALPAQAWDLICSATAYHWVPATERMTRPHRLLKPGGVLALIDTVQVQDPADRDYFERSQPLYARYWPEQTTFRPSPMPDEVEPSFLTEMQASGRFDDVQAWRFRWDQRYDVDSYMALVRSYSNTYALPPDTRAQFLADLRTFVEAEEDATVLRPLVITLVAGRCR